MYGATRTFPAEERFGLTSQIRRAAVSIPTNIAEGCGRRSEAEFANFLNIAMGSASELEYLLLLAGELNLIGADKEEALSAEVVEIKRMLTAFMQKLKADR